ncbi:3-isopropylmalate dehydrogenase [Venenivibrio stagnispumantis]|uniref:3-isopropylmalate dehydrogenase n=1 Tax=Venenivibrio stagnispumantis TaxID=407998 RepID=A0AA45WKQ7_9AQUI|nr:3-isopropylmalate dehydrogenase [Venenivibrio stagnispumantis]MCW4573029.1 3-isopropylmalate dehydrogenase [Venenivibrio stagnispumantis]SMP07656.1 3-isopropylmalate dehydrogenase [Venenivibrio stagnispumantis]
MKKHFKIAVLPGDGIGPEIIDAALKVLDVISKKYGITFEFEKALVGGAAIDAVGDPLPEETLKLCKESDAVLFGAVGGEKWDNLPTDKRPEKGLLRIRKELNLFANIRPAKAYDALLDASPLKQEIIKGVNLVVLRELTGDVYFGEPRGIEERNNERVGYNTMIYYEHEIKRIARLAFEIARGRRNKVTSVDKANVLEVSALWREVVNEVHNDYADVELEHMYVDNCAMQLIRRPRDFDVIVTGNIFGDIISDEAGALTGSLGMLPSASIGERYAFYEPIHGSAPDIAGKGIANPIATILSAAMMLELTCKLPEAARDIENAVEKVLEEGYRTADIWSVGTKRVNTQEMTEAIIKHL